MKKYQKLTLLMAIGFSAVSCMNEENENLNEPQSQAALSAVAEGSSGSSSANERVIVNGFATSEFSVGTQNVKMRYVAKADILAGIGLGNITLKSNVNAALQSSASQSKTLVLITQGDTKVSTVGEGSTPEGNYKEVEFKLYKNTQVSQSDPMFDKSLRIAGEFNSKFTTIWMNTEKTIVATAEASDGVEVDGQTEMLLVFDMNRLFANVDFSSATETNGRIEIGPNSTGANAAIFSQVESNLESAVILKKK